MGKALAVVLALIVIVGGGAYYIMNQNKANNIKTIAPTPVVIANRISPTPTSAPLLTTDTAIDTDITALDKDLAELDQSDKALTQDLNGL